MSSSAKAGDANNHTMLGRRFPFIKAIRRTLRERRKRTKWRRELEVLSDYALRDIGVMRCEINYRVP